MITIALVVLLSSLFVATTFIYEYFNKTQVKQLKEELELVKKTVNNVGVEYFENFDSTIFRFTVVDENGTVLYDTVADATQMENHSDREEISEAILDGKGSSTRYSETLTEETIYEAVRLEDVMNIPTSELVEKL